MSAISHARLLELVSYEPETGLFRRKSKWGRLLPGSITGSKSTDGYITVHVDGRAYYGHRLAWFYTTGEWAEEVDHENRVRSDNRWDNLRDASHQQNTWNQGMRTNNTSGVKGASQMTNGRWRAFIVLDGKQKHLGCFASKEEASAAYASAAETLFGEFAAA